MAKQYDATLKHLVESRPLDWLDLAGLPHGPSARLVDADLSAVTAATDKVVLVEGAAPYIAHLEFQSGPDPDLDQRVLLYNVLLRWRHRMPVRSVVFLLSPNAGGPTVTGRFAEQQEPAESIAFAYKLVPVWELSADTMLAGHIGTVPLAPVVADASVLPAVVERVGKRLRAELSATEANLLLVAALTLAGLRHDRDAVRKAFSRIKDMNINPEESTFVQIFLEQGEARGLLKARRDDVLVVGRERFGEPSPDVLAILQSTNDPNRLQHLLRRSLAVSSWTELLAS